MALIDRKVYNTLATSPNRIPNAVGSDRFPIASIQIDNFSGKYIQVDGTQFVPPFAQGWVTTLAPTPKTSVPIAVTVPPVGSQTGNDGTVVITLFEEAIGSSGGSTSQYSPIPEIVSLAALVNTAVAGQANNLNLTQLGITGGSFYIKSMHLAPEPPVVLATTAWAEVNFGTARGNGAYTLCINANQPNDWVDCNDLIANSAAVVITGWAAAGNPQLRLDIDFSQA